jgi:hypothetical protein
MPYQIMYSSQATAPMTSAELERILADARTGNEARDVTGVLIYVDGVFVQILEGDEDVVRNLVESIKADARHHAVKVFHVAEVDERAFQAWSMAYLSPSAEEMSAWAGLPGTATVEELLAEIDRDPSRVPRILVNVLEDLAV